MRKISFWSLKRTVSMRTSKESSHRKFTKILWDNRELPVYSHRICGRYLNLKVEDRICNVCMVIEDEIHALCQCKKFSLLREQMYQTVFKTNVNSVVGKMDIESFIDLLTSTDSDVLRAVASFIYTANIT